MPLDYRVTAVEKDVLELKSLVFSIRQDSAAKERDLQHTMEKANETTAIVEKIHLLALSVSELTLQVKAQGERMEAVINSSDLRFKNQGERIGALETVGSKRWEAIIKQAIGLIVAAAVGAILSGHLSI